MTIHHAAAPHGAGNERAYDSWKKVGDTYWVSRTMLPEDSSLPEADRIKLIQQDHEEQLKGIQE